MQTSLEGKTLSQSKLREKTGMTVVGFWERGRFKMPRPDTRIDSNTLLVLAGSAEQLEKYNEVLFVCLPTDAPVLILGGGRVGCAAARVLEEWQIPYTVVEKDLNLIQNDNYIRGNAADIDTLIRAGIQEAPSVIVTTHDDSMNIYLTIYCRKLRSDIQIVSRANAEENVSTLHRAGADLVMSYASMGANAIINLLKPNKILMFQEGLNIFRASVRSSLAGKSLGESQTRNQTGCNVIAIARENELNINPEPSILLEEHDEMIMIGTSEAEKRFMDILNVDKTA